MIIVSGTKQLYESSIEDRLNPKLFEVYGPLRYFLKSILNHPYPKCVIITFVRNDYFDINFSYGGYLGTIYDGFTPRINSLLFRWPDVFRYQNDGQRAFRECVLKRLPALEEKQ